MTGTAAPRSLLFVPASDGRKLAKALGCGADAVILDREDAVAADAKAAARDQAARFLAAHAGDAGRPLLCVRVNDLASGLTAADLAAVMPVGPDLVMLPKANSGADVAGMAARLDALDPQTRTGIIVITSETPQSVLAMGSFVGASARLRGLTWGSEDLSTALGASTARDDAGALTDPYSLARSLCLITACAAGVQPVDGIYADFRDLEGLAREARAAARDGFSGKLAIHPAQVPVINAAFTPSRAQISRAEAIIAAFQAQGDAGVIAFEGRMLDRPHLEQARRLLARAGRWP